MATSILPEDIIASEILTRLPSKSLLRFRSVSKTWNNLISDPFFIAQHFDRSVERQAMHITLVFSTSPLTICSIDPENLGSTLPDDNNVYPPPFTSFHSRIGACDGLVCTTLNSETVSVWHASTRTSMTFRYAALPTDPSTCGFFYDSTSHEYKLVSVTYSEEQHSSEVIVHSAEYTECRWIRSIPYQMINARGVVVNGSVHWLASNCSQDHSSHEQVIFALNPMCQELEEMSKVIPIPTNTKAGLGCVNLAQLGGSLSIVFSYQKRTEIWLMKEYGVKESWSKYFSFLTDNLYFLTRPLRVVPLYITKKGDLILQINKKTLFMHAKEGKRLISIKYPEPGPGRNQYFDAVTLLDSLVDVRNGHGGGKPFLGRQIKRGKICKENHNMESDFANNFLILDSLVDTQNDHGGGKPCLGRQIERVKNCRDNHSMGSESSSASTDRGSLYRKMLGARFVQKVFRTSDNILYEFINDSKLNVQAAAKFFFEQVRRSVFREFAPYFKKEFILRLPEITGDATTLDQIIEKMKAYMRQVLFENSSVSSDPERLNHAAVPIPEFGAPQQQCLECRFYQLIRNTQLHYFVYGYAAAYLAIIRSLINILPQLETEIETCLEWLARYVNVSPDSAKGVGESESGSASKVSVMDTNDANVSSAQERMNTKVSGAPHNQSQQLPGLAEGQIYCKDFHDVFSAEYLDELFLIQFLF